MLHAAAWTKPISPSFLPVPLTFISRSCEGVVYIAAPTRPLIVEAHEFTSHESSRVTTSITPPETCLRTSALLQERQGRVAAPEPRNPPLSSFDVTSPWQPEHHID